MTELDELRRQIESEECAALFDSVRYMLDHGEAYVRELYRDLPSVRKLSTGRMRRLLNEAAASGELETELRLPPHPGEPHAGMQRRYYWIPPAERGARSDSKEVDKEDSK